MDEGLRLQEGTKESSEIALDALYNAETVADQNRPKPFNYDAVMLMDEWEKWMNSFRMHMQKTGINSMADDQKISALLFELGPKGKTLFETFKTSLPTSLSHTQTQAVPEQNPSFGSHAEMASFDLNKFEDVISAFNSHFINNSSRNLVYERFKFNTFNWLFGQPLSDYIKVLRRAAVRCDFLEADCMIRDRLLLQIRDIALLERLLKIKDLTLEQAIEIFQEHEDNDFRHNLAAKRPPPESESAAKRRRRRKRKGASLSEPARVEPQSNGQRNGSGPDGNFNKAPDTAKLRPSKKKRHRWAKALQNVKQAMLT